MAKVIQLKPIQLEKCDNCGGELWYWSMIPEDDYFIVEMTCANPECGEVYHININTGFHVELE